LAFDNDTNGARPGPTAPPPDAIANPPRPRDEPSRNIQQFSILAHGPE
jgi:hypothetical protein